MRREQTCQICQLLEEMLFTFGESNGEVRVKRFPSELFKGGTWTGDLQHAIVAFWGRENCWNNWKLAGNVRIQTETEIGSRKYRTLSSSTSNVDTVLCEIGTSQFIKLYNYSPGICETIQ